MKMKKSRPFYSPYCQYNRPDDGLPWFINVIVTTHCNLRCKQCKSWEVSQELGPTEKVLAFFQRLADGLPLPRMVILTGGEPLLHPDIFLIVEKLSSLGFLPALNTNGAALSPEVVQRLVDAGLDVINISLDGTADVHDRQRSGPGLYQGVMDMIHYISNHTRLKTGIVSVISAWSARGLPALVKMLSKNDRLGGIQLQAIIPTMSRPWDDAFFDNSPLWPRTSEQKDEVMAALSRLERLRAQGCPINNPPSQFEHWRRYFKDPKNFITAGKCCTVADNNLLIKATGAVQFCNMYGDLGTLDDDPLKLWRSEKAQRMREEMKSCPYPCNFYVNCCYVEEDC